MPTATRPTVPFGAEAFYGQSQMPKYGPATPPDRPVFEWERRTPAPLHETVLPSPERLAEGMEVGDLADLYWRCRWLPGETTIVEGRGVEHGPRSAIVSEALKLACEEEGPRPV